MISMISCVTRNNGIGYQGDLIIKSQKDMKRFQAKTKNKKVVMGYGTWKSLPENALPKRHNYVLTHEITPEMKMIHELFEKDFLETGTHIEFILHDSEQQVQKNVDLFKELAEDEEVVIIGGQRVYELFIPYAKRLYLTYADVDFEADRYFPIFNTDSWEVIEKRVVNDRIDKHTKCDLTFLTLDRELPKTEVATYPLDIEKFKEKTAKGLFKAKEFISNSPTLMPI